MENKETKIYIDPASIHAAFEKAHPELRVTSCHLNFMNDGVFAWVDVFDDTIPKEGLVEITVKQWDERWSYHGLQIGVNRWTRKINEV